MTVWLFLPCLLLSLAFTLTVVAPFLVRWVLDD